MSLSRVSVMGCESKMLNRRSWPVWLATSCSRRRRMSASAVGIIPGLGGGADADAVGLALLAAAVAAQPRAAHGVNRGVDQRAQVFADHTADHVAGQGEQAGQDAFALLPGRVTLRDVGDFMGQHPGEFILPVDQGQQPAGDVNATARNGEGVGFGLVHDLKAELPARVVHRGHQSPAHFAQVSLGFGHGVEADLLLDQLRHLRALLDVALGGRAQQLTLRRGGEHPDRQRGEGQAPR